MTGWLARLVPALIVLAVSVPAQAGRFAVVFSNNLGDAGEQPLRHADADGRLVAEALSTLGDFPPGLVLLLEAGTTTPRRRPMVGFAVATGVAIAAYTVTDGLNHRR